jgi:hypothetical protein
MPLQVEKEKVWAAASLAAGSRQTASRNRHATPRTNVERDRVDLKVLASWLLG